MANNDYAKGKEIGKHEELIKHAHERLDLHEKRLEGVEEWQSEEEKNRNKKQSQFSE